MFMIMNEKFMYLNFVLVYQLYLSECQEQGFDNILLKLIIEFLFDYRLIVVLVSKIHIFSFPNQCRLLHTIDTRDNPRGRLII